MLTCPHVCKMPMRTLVCTHNIRNTCIEVGSQTYRKYQLILVSRMLQSEQSDILHNCYPLHILLEFDLGILRKYSEYIKKEDKIEP